MNWPEVFEHPELLDTEAPEVLCAQGLSAWGISCSGMGGKLPANFGTVLVKIALRTGATSATAEGLMECADRNGWGKPAETEQSQ